MCCRALFVIITNDDYESCHAQDIGPDEPGGAGGDANVTSQLHRVN